MSFKRRTTRAQFFKSLGWKEDGDHQHPFQWTKYDERGQRIAQRFETSGSEHSATWKEDELAWEAYCKLNPDKVI